MTRKEQRSLLESLFDLRALLPRTELREAGERTLLEETLSAAESLCARTLSSGRSASYQELFGDMLTVLQSADWASLSAVQETEIRKLLDELLEAAIRTVQGEKEVKKLFLFLPYKASMWDSLESIWKAAAEDAEHTEAHVVPIPYADRNPDGSAAAWHCEAGDFPDYVPVEDWQDYTLDTLKELRPDAIFIHNPYDGNNYVTSVEAQYYSDKLKECTDCLVYVPYFVSGASVSVGMCQSPGIVNADYVVVESGEIRAQYIKYYPKQKMAKGKFLVFGSPKYDRILNSSRDDYDLPPEWEQLIDNRKIILYNTSLIPVLPKVGYVCQKMRKVFMFFREQKDFVLWWRPHPLMKATLRSMHPEIYGEYEALEKEYRLNGWGIYDDSPDVDRAIVCTTAYYGDLSSVLTLYQATGKPGLLQEYSDRIWVAASYQCSIENDVIYFVDSYTGALMHIDRNSGRATLDARIPKDFQRGNDSYGCLAKQGDVAILMPMDAQEILAYDYQTKRFSALGCTENAYLETGAGYFTKAIYYKEYCYCFSWANSEIIKINRNTREVKRLTEWFHALESIIGHDQPQTAENVYVLKAMAQDGSHVLIGLGNANIIIDFDMDTDTFDLHQVGDSSWGFWSMDFDGEDFWLLGRRDMPVIRWNRMTGKLRLYPEILPYAAQIKGYLYPYVHIVAKKESITLYPHSLTKNTAILDIDKKTGHVVARPQETMAVAMVQRYGRDKVLRVLTGEDKNVFVFEEDTGEQHIEVTRDLLSERICLDELPFVGFFKETVVTLPHMLKHLRGGKNYDHPAVPQDCGIRTYQFVRDR